LVVWQGGTLEAFPDLSQPEEAYVQHPGSDLNFTVKLRGVYARHLDMGELVEMARHAVVGRAEELMRQNGSLVVEHVLLDLPCTFFMLRSLRFPPFSSRSVKSGEGTKQ
jgi:hypothetical protein